MTDVMQLLNRIESIAVPPQPVPWFLDIDGVLNLGSARSQARGWPYYDAGHVVSHTRGVQYFSWAPLLMEVINAMVARGLVQVRWLTSWEFEGPSAVAPVLRLKVGDWVAGDNRLDEDFAWKLRVIQEHMAYDDKFFIWTDDDIERFRPARQVVDFLPEVRALVICPDEQEGLTPEQISRILDAIEAWL